MYNQCAIVNPIGSCKRSDLKVKKDPGPLDDWERNSSRTTCSSCTHEGNPNSRE